MVAGNIQKLAFRQWTQLVAQSSFRRLMCLAERQLQVREWLRRQHREVRQELKLRGLDRRLHRCLQDGQKLRLNLRGKGTLITTSPARLMLC